MAGRLLDASALIEVERGGITLQTLLGETQDQQASIAAVTISELLMGALLANTAQRRRKRERFLEVVLRHALVEDFGADVARAYAHLLVDLRRAGYTVGAHDAQIAATALVHHQEVVTLNARDFQRVPNLRVHVLRVSRP